MDVVLTNDELFEVNGGGDVALFMSMVGIGLSLPLICFNPPAGVVFLGACISVFENNL